MLFQTHLPNNVGEGLRCPVLDRHMDTQTALEPVPRAQQYQEELRVAKTWTRLHMTSTNRRGGERPGKAIEPERRQR